MAGDGIAQRSGSVGSSSQAVAGLNLILKYKPKLLIPRAWRSKTVQCQQSQRLWKRPIQNYFQTKRCRCVWFRDTENQNLVLVADGAWHRGGIVASHLPALGLNLTAQKEISNEYLSAALWGTKLLPRKSKRHKKISIDPGLEIWTLLTWLCAVSSWEICREDRMQKIVLR